MVNKSKVTSSLILFLLDSFKNNKLNRGTSLNVFTMEVNGL